MENNRLLQVENQIKFLNKPDIALSEAMRKVSILITRLLNVKHGGKISLKSLKFIIFPHHLRISKENSRIQQKKNCKMCTSQKQFTT